jgi:hypothetical protein
MTRHPIARLEEKERTGARPPGYAAAVIAAGKVVGADVWLPPEKHAELRARFHPVEKWPTVAEMALNFGGAMARWIKGGFKVASEAEFQRRLLICQGCPNWSATAGIGRCKKCGCCTSLKLWLETERCPLGKWALSRP